MWISPEWLITLTLLSRSCFAQSSKACNNSPALCDRAYNNVTYLGAHDSMFVRNSSNGFSVAGDQFFTSPVQLDAGVRLLTGQVYNVSDTGADEYLLCHSLCALYDAGSLLGWLSSIKSWLDDNPNEVVTILLVNSNNLNASQLGPQFEASEIVPYAYVPDDPSQAQATWPTLDDMINMNKRLVIFIASLDPVTSSDAPYLLDEFTFVFENNYDVTDPSAFSCVANRPSSVENNTSAALQMNLLPLMNHFLYDENSGIEFPAVENVTVTNAPSGGTGNLGDAATECTNEYGKPPTYILVDFFNTGPAIDTVDRLNGVQGNIVGRRSLPESTYTAGAGPTETAPLSHTSTPTANPTSTTSSPATTHTGNAGMKVCVRPSMLLLLLSVLGVSVF